MMTWEGVRTQGADARVRRREPADQGAVWLNQGRSMACEPGCGLAWCCTAGIRTGSESEGVRLFQCNTTLGNAGSRVLPCKITQSVRTEQSVKLRVRSIVCKFGVLAPSVSGLFQAWQLTSRFLDH